VTGGVASEEVNLPDAGHKVVRGMRRRKKGTAHPEIIDAGMAVVVGAVMVEITISPGGRAEVRGTGPVVSPLGIDVSTGPPIVTAVIPWGCPPVGVGITGLMTSSTSENPKPALSTGASPPNETGGLGPFWGVEVSEGASCILVGTGKEVEAGVASATVWRVLWTTGDDGTMTSRATGGAKGFVMTAGCDPDNDRGLWLRHVSGSALACHKGISATVETHLEKTKDEWPKLGTVTVGLLKEEKVDWVLVGENAVPDSSLRHWLRGTIFADVPSLGGCDDVAKPIVDAGGVLIVEELVGDGNSDNDEDETGYHAIMNTKRKKPKVEYALAIGGDVDVCKLVEGDRE
jgi:hypothetical protein